MTGTVVLILRILLAACLYGFLVWALLAIWRDLRVQGQLISAPHIPTLSIALVEVGSGEAGEWRSFQEPELFIGRSETSQVTLPDETVSARHARLSYHHNQWWLEDLRSTNGTFLNDERVSVPTVIVSGDELRCGQVNLLIGVENQR